MKPKDKKEKSIQKMIEEHKAGLGTVVAERWWVEEYRPSYVESGYYGSYVPETIVQKSQYFDNQDEAWDYFDSMEPSNSTNRLRLRHQKCYERLERRWL